MLSLRLVLIARVCRSRADALAFALAEVGRPNATMAYKLWLTDYISDYGGHPALMQAAAPHSLKSVIRRALAIPELALLHLPSAEDCYRLLSQGYTKVPLPDQKPPNKSNLYMNILEPAGQS